MIDFNFYKNGLKKDKYSYNELPDEVRLNIGFWSECIKEYSVSILKKLPYNKETLKLTKALVKESSLVMFGLRDEFKEDRELVAIACKAHGLAITNVPNYKGDKEIVEIAIRSDGNAYASISPELKANRDLALLAIEKQAIMFFTLPESFKNDKEFILKAMDYSNLMKTIDPKWFSDSEVMTAAILKDYTNVQYLNKSLHFDENVLRAIIRNAGKFLDGTVPEWLLNNKEFLLERVRSYPSIVYDTKDLVNKDNEFLFDLMRNNYRMYYYLDDNKKSNEEIALMFVCYSNEITSVPKELLDNISFVDKILNNNIMFLKDLKEDIQYNKELLYKHEKSISDVAISGHLLNIFEVLNTYKKQDERSVKLKNILIEEKEHDCINIKKKI